MDESIVSEAGSDGVPASRTVHFVSLGCPKNRVDSEVMLGGALQKGYRHVDEAGDAEVIVVNTCGFIDSAKKESIETILEMAELKKSGRCKKLVVSGCLSQRYSGELAESLPEVDHFLGSSDMPKLTAVLEGERARMLVGQPKDWVVSAEDPRILSTRGASAYVKVAEGCNRSCSFCVIPKMRGKQRSRSVDDIVREVERLVSMGVLEINLISQDTIAYGRDLGDGTSLEKLVQKVAEVRGLHWLRIFYLYPETITDGLLELLDSHPVVLPYVDMPLQHAADGMLRRMKRGHGGKRLYSLVEKLRSKVRDLTFRTAFIVGHPGETEQEFAELCDFVRFAEFDRVGVFRYSDEEDCEARGFAEKVRPIESYQRHRKLMALQREISRKKNRALVGRELEVLVEGPSDESDLVLVGRHRGQAPEIDGVVYLSQGDPRPGTIVKARIDKATDYDLLGVLDEEGDVIMGAAAEPSLRAPALVIKASDGRRVLRTL